MTDHVVSELTNMGWPQDRVVSALRLRGGDQNRAVEWLLQHGPSFAPATGSGTRRGAPDDSSIEALEGFGFTRAQATAALRVTSNVEFAASWILDHPEAGTSGEDEEAETSTGDENSVSSRAETSVIATTAGYSQDLAIAAGHFLQDGEGFCSLCRMELGSEIAGRGRCIACQLCTGCCAAGVVHRCPSLANGGSVHQHALRYSRQDRLGCAVRGENCLHPTTAWQCTAGCRFAVCAVCIASPEATSWSRQGRQGAGKGKGKGKGKGPNAGIEDPPEMPAFDAAIAERIAAQGWQLRSVAEEGAELQIEGADRVVLGSGTVGANDEFLEASDVVVPVSQPTATLERSLSLRSRAALDSFKGQGGPSLRAARAAIEGYPPDEEDEENERAVANVTAAEDLLLHGEAVGLKSSEHDQLRAAIAAGDLRLAGQFIMGASLCEAVAPSSANGQIRNGPAGSILCPVCAEEIRGAGSRGGVVGCLNGHAIHASCAADLALGGGVCPTCRTPLFYAQVPKAEVGVARQMAKVDIRKNLERSHESEKMGEIREYQVGDRVRIHSDVAHCKSVQSLPGVGGWQEEMCRACGTEGEVVEIIKAIDPARDESSLDDSQSTHRLTLVEVCNDGLEGQDIWRWTAELLSLVNATTEAPDKERAVAMESMEQLARLRNELAAVKRARTEVGSKIATALGVPIDRIPIGKQTGVVLPPALERHLTVRSVEAVTHLGMTIAPVDMQRARHLLALARQWGDSQKAKEARALLHGAVCAGDIDSVARNVRRYNAAECMHRLEWMDAVSEISSYRVAPGVRIELLGRPRHGAPRTGYTLLPGVEFTSVKEVADVDGNHWLRVGNARNLADEAFKASSSSASSTKVSDGGRRNISVRLEDFPHAVGARVMRGPDWQFDNEDGGQGSVGILLGLYPAARGWARVRWDHGTRAENYHRVGAEGSFDLAYVGPAPQPPLSAQGWLRVRPGGPGTSPVVARVRGALRCFDCGGELAAPFCATQMGKTQSGRSPLTPVAVDELHPGDIVLIAATLERVVVVEIIVPPSIPARRHSEKQNGVEKFGLSVLPCGELSVASSSEPKQRVEDDTVISVEESASLAEAPLPLPQPLILCSFIDDAHDPVPGSEGIDASEDAVAFRAADLVWPAHGAGKSGTAEDLIEFQGRLHNRRELVLILGSEESARRVWSESKASAELGMTFASCVRGHLLHARCFQGRLLAGRGCPACSEALFVPSVQRTRRDGEDECCGSVNDGTTAQALGEAQAAEVAAAEQATSSTPQNREHEAPTTVESTRGGRVQMKMCPVCCSGPLLNESCSDLRAHHGQCPQCQAYPHSAAAIAEALAKNVTATVGDRIPRCGTCNVAVTFNGCQECGHLFADIDWENLPAWDVSAKGCLEVSIRHRRAARLLAEQVRYEAALLAHERAALEEAHGSTELLCVECKLEPPPPPVPLPPRCGVKCQRRHRGPCLVCDADARQHEGHFCPDGRRGSWLLVAQPEGDQFADDFFDEGGEGDIEEEEEE